MLCLLSQYIIHIYQEAHIGIRADKLITGGNIVITAGNINIAMRATAI
tara:strand:+ start:12792 stop:12935 length:144 start_codon:yes stop_codon:yes gene_type:complete